MDTEKLTRKDVDNAKKFNDRIIKKILLLNKILDKHNMGIDKFSYNGIAKVDVTILILPDDYENADKS